MTLVDRLERLANRTPEGDPVEVLAEARRLAQEDRTPGARSPRLLVAAVVAVLVVAAGALAVTGNGDDSVTVAGPDSPGTVEGAWLLAATVRAGEQQPARAAATITVEGDTVTGTDGCGNTIRARLTDGTLTYDGRHMLIGCPDDAADDDANHFWRVIEQQPAYDVRDEKLWLVGGDGDGLVFARPDGDPVKGKPVVTVAVDNLGPVAASVSPLTASEKGWMEHTVTLENSGSRPVYLNDFRSGAMLDDREVAVATEGCGYADQPVTIFCQYDYRPVTIEPGGSHSFTATVWRDLAGMNPVGEGPHEWALRIDHADRPFEHPDETGTTGTVALTYASLAGDTTDPAPDPSTTTASSTPVVEVDLGVFDDDQARPGTGLAVREYRLDGGLHVEGGCVWALPADDDPDKRPIPLEWRNGTAARFLPEQDSFDLVQDGRVVAVDGERVELEVSAWPAPAIRCQSVSARAPLRVFGTVERVGSPNGP